MLPDCSHTPEEKLSHKAVENELLGNPLTKEEKPKWTTAMYQKLAMAATATCLPDLDSKVNLKVKSLNKDIVKERFWDDWIKALHLEKTPIAMTPAEQLARLCMGAPKNRALLRNLKDQVRQPGR